MRKLLILLLLGAGCRGPGPVAGRPLREFRGIIHCHSLYSHDSKGTYEEILAAAKAAQVDFVCITDHPPKGDGGRSLREGWSGLRDGVLFIQGHEYAGSNLLALGIREEVHKAPPADMIAAIHRQGGVAIVSHPEEVADWTPYLTADGMEVYNLHAAWKRRQGDLGFYAQALKLLKEKPDEVFSLLQELDPAVLAKWDEINRTRRFVGVAGNDAHQNVRIGSIQVDPYERVFRFVSTRVFSLELTEPSILGALRQGRCAITFDLLGTPSRFALDWHDSDSPAGRSVAQPIGSEVILLPGHSVDLMLSWDDPGEAEGAGVFRRPEPGQDARLETYVTRSLVAEGVWRRRCYFLTQDGAYRFTIFREAGGVRRPWILTNHVSLRMKS